MKKDNTDNWIRERLYNFKPEAPLDAWDKLEAVIPGVKRRKPFLFWLQSGTAKTSVVLIAAMVLCSAILFDSYKSESLKSLSILRNEQSKLTPKITNKLVLENKSAKLSQGRNNILAHEPKLIFKFKNNSNNFSTPINQEIDFPKSNEAVSFQVEISKTNILLDNKPNLPFGYEILFGLPIRNTKEIASNNHEELDLILNSDDIKHKIQPKTKIWISAQMMPLAVLNIGSKTSNLQGIYFDENQSGLNTGFQNGLFIKLQPNQKWRFGSGIIRESTQMMNSHTAILRLQDGQLIDPNGTGSKNFLFEYSLVSHGSISDVSLRLSQQHAQITMAQDEPFTLDMTTVSRRTIWSIPLTVQRLFGGGKWQGFIEGSALINFSDRTRFEVKHFSEMCSDLCFELGVIPTLNASHGTQISSSWQISSGVERMISNKMGISISPVVGGAFDKYFMNRMQIGLSARLIFQLY